MCGWQGNPHPLRANGTVQRTEAADWQRPRTGVTLSRLARGAQSSLVGWAVKECVLENSWIFTLKDLNTRIRDRYLGKERTFGSTCDTNHWMSWSPREYQAVEGPTRIPGPFQHTPTAQTYVRYIFAPRLEEALTSVSYTRTPLTLSKRQLQKDSNFPKRESACYSRIGMCRLS